MNRPQGFTSERLQASQFFILTDTFNMCHPSWVSRTFDEERMFFLSEMRREEAISERGLAARLLEE
jgi:hypothetical protein